MRVSTEITKRKKLSMIHIRGWGYGTSLYRLAPIDNVNYVNYEQGISFATPMIANNNDATRNLAIFTVYLLRFAVNHSVTLLLNVAWVVSCR